MRKVLIFALINLVVLGSLTAPVVIGLPLVIARLVPEAERTTVLATVTICGAVASIIANPLFGFLSDRTAGRFGRRRPWLLGGVVIGLAASMIIAVADSLMVLTLGWILAQTAYNASLAAVAAMLGDQVEEGRRASASGVFGAAAFLGTLPPLILAASLPSQLPIVVLTMPVVALFVVGICCVLISDPQATNQVPVTMLDHLGKWVDIRRYRLFAWVWLQRFLMQLAFSLVTVFTLYFVVARLAINPEDGAFVVAVTTLSGGSAIVVAALSAGFFAGRRGRYGPYIIVASVGLAGAAVLRATVVTGPQLWISATLGGLALGIFYAVDLALVLRTVPKGESGAVLGVFNIAETLPQTIAPALAMVVLVFSGADPLSSSADNYVALYLTAAGVALLALIPLVFLRPILNRTDPHRFVRERRLIGR